MSLSEILLSNSFSCSWEAENKNIIDSVTWSRSYRSGMEAVSVDTCALLSRGNAPRECQPEIRLVLRNNYRVARATVVSDARIIEVYGTCGEYVTTQTADFVDEFEDMAVYVAEVALPDPLSECALKFAGLKTSHNMWLYSIHLTVEEMQPVAPAKRLIDFQNVNNMIKRSGGKLSEKAERCQNFLESCTSSLDPRVSAEVLSLFEALQDHYPENGNKASSSSKARGFADLLGKCSSRHWLVNGSLDAGSPSDDGDQRMWSRESCLKDYIDCKFAQSEKLLLDRIDERFRELEARQNVKLDLILQHLNMLNMQQYQATNVSEKTQVSVTK